MRAPTPAAVDAVVHASGLRLCGGGPEDPVIACSFDLFPGELALAEIDEPGYERWLLDALVGIDRPRAGDLIVLNRRWSDFRGRDTSFLRARRGSIGHAFGAGSWIETLTVPENLALVERYHTRRSREAILAEADDLCRLLDLPGLPVGEIEDTSPSDLARAALARAFLGEPGLVLLEAAAVASTALPPGPILNLCRQATDRGAAALACVRGTTAAEFRTLPVDRRLRFRGLALRAVEGRP